jgi:membrane-bound lytic murein transglycosylase D
MKLAIRYRIADARALCLAALLTVLAGCSALRPEVSVTPAAPEAVEAVSASESTAPAQTKATPVRKAAVPEVIPSVESKPQSSEDFWTSLSEARRFKDCDYDPDIGMWTKRLVGSKASFKANVERFLPYMDFVWRQAQALNMPAEVAFLPLVESDYRQVYGSYGSPGGWWQLMPAVAGDYQLSTKRGFDQRLDPVLATDAALKLIQANASRFEGDWLLAIFAYNVGGQRIQRQLNALSLRPGEIEHVSQLNLPATTEHHLHRLIAWGCIFAHPERYGAELPPGPQEREQYQATRAEQALPARAIAAALGGTRGQHWLSQHPILAKGKIQPGTAFLAPRDFGQLLSALGDLDKYRVEAKPEVVAVQANSTRLAQTANKRAAAAPNGIQVPSTYQVKYGDSLWTIARRFDMRVNDILALNPGLNRKSVLKLKQKLRLQ